MRRLLRAPMPGMHAPNRDPAGHDPLLDALANAGTGQSWLASATDVAAVGVWEADFAAGTFRASPAAMRLHGLAPDAPIDPEHAFRVLHPEDRARVQAAVRRATEHGESYREEVRVLMPDGTTRWLAELGRGMLDDAGRPLRRLVGLSRDITADRAAREALEESERRFRVTFESAPVGMAHVALDGRWLLMNQRLTEIFGYSREELASLSFQDVTHPDDLAADLEYVRRALAGEIDRYDMEKRYVRKDGTHVWACLTVSLVRRSDGTPDYFVSVVDDITHRKQAHAALRAAQAEADRANRAKSQFLAVMSHELRTPLNGIGGYADLIALGVYGPVTDAQREALTRIDRAQRHLLSIIDEILGYARIEAGHTEYNLSAVPLTDLLHDVEAMTQPLARRKSIQFETTASDDGITVRADRDKLRQILVNLLGNALKFTPDGGRVSLGAAVAGAVVELRVSDSGRGIPPDQIESIFQPFVRLRHAQHEPAEGTGLGLAICREYARGMGGDVTAQSVPGEGTTFTVTLPLTPVD